MCENMEADDDMILIVVGDEDEKEQQQLVTHDGITVKVEPLDEEMGVDELFETVEKHGVVVDIDLNQIIKQEPVENFEDEEVEYIDDSIFAENEDIEEEEFTPLVPRKRSKKKNRKKEPTRKVLPKPHERKSYVKQLKSERPELKKDQKLLINTLVDIMKSIKPPKLPENYSKLNSDNHYECSQCDHTCRTEPAAERHYQEMHGERYLKCMACGVDFRSKTNLYKHEKRCPAPDAVVVLKARALFVGRKGRSRPFIPNYENHKKKSYYKRHSLQCELCPATFSGKVGLQSHYYLHNGVRPFRCSQCPAAYTSPTALMRHISKHSSVEYICDHCQRSFKVKAALVLHMNVHRPEKPWACDRCGKRYAQKSALQLHVHREHLHLPPPCACQICPRRYPRMSLLKTHMLKEHGMSVLTRKMFLRYLPTMPEEQFIEEAKLIFKDQTEKYGSESEMILPTLGHENIVHPTKDFKNINRQEPIEIEINPHTIKNPAKYQKVDSNELTSEQEELLALLENAQNKDIKDSVKLYSVRNNSRSGFDGAEESEIVLQ